MTKQQIQQIMMKYLDYGTYDFRTRKAFEECVSDLESGIKDHFNRENHLLVIKDRKTGEIIDSLKLMWLEDDTVHVSYKGNVSVECKKWNGKLCSKIEAMKG